jgi:glycosyltransferase involved in cell wall biosynthesis
MPLDLSVGLGLLRSARHHRDELLVLTFHRVMGESERANYAYPGLAVTEEELAVVVGALREDYDLGPLSAQLDRLRAGERPGKPLLALTFDDGQVDDLRRAAPVLERLGVRGTFYLPIEAVQSGRTLFHDTLGFAFTALPAPARADILVAYGLPCDLDAGAVADAQKPWPVERRQALLDAFLGATGRPLDVLVPDWARPLTLDEARELAARGHEIGSHACSHRPLPELDDATLRDECTRSKRVLETALGIRVRSLCYPNGNADARTAQAAREAGYDNAVTTRYGAARADTDPYLLPRCDLDARRVSGNEGISRGLLELRLSGLRKGLENANCAACTPHGARTIAYFVSEYPSRSHTFIRREIEALRARGVHIRPFAIRRANASTMLDQRDRDSYAETTPILPIRPAQVARAHGRALVRQPRAYFRALRDATTHRLPGLKNLVWSLFHFVEGIVLSEELALVEARHLHVHFANAGANVGRIAARHRGIPYSMTLHGASDFEFSAGPLLAAKLHESAFAVCVSKFGRAQAMRLLPPEAWRKLLIVRCGVELARMPPRAPHGEGHIEVVCVGRLSSEKGHLGLVEAFALAQQSEPRLSLVLVGDGPLRGEIEASIARLGLHDSVRLTGALAEGAALAAIARADIFALPSFMEGIPLVLMEAMALGVPVVAPRVSGIPELVEEGATGLLYTASAWDEMAEAIVRLARDDGLRARLTAAGRHKVEAEFAVDCAVSPLEDRFRGA